MKKCIKFGKFVKCAICVAMIVVLLLSAACNSGNASVATTYGRFVEADITPPIAGQFMSLVAQDGSLVAFDRGLRVRYDSTDGGETWTRGIAPSADNNRFANVQHGAFLPDGSVLVFVQGEGMVAIAVDGSSTPFPVSEVDALIAEGESVSVSLIQVLGDDRLLLNFSIGGLAGLVQEIPQGGMGGMAQGGTPAERPTMGGGATSGVGGGGMANIIGGVTGGMSNIGGGTGGMGGINISNMLNPAQRTTLHSLSTGALISELPAENVRAATGGGDYFYLLDASNDISRFATSNGAVSNLSAAHLGGGVTGGFMGMALPAMFTGGGNVLTMNPYDELYVMHEGSLLHLANGRLETLLDGTAFSFGAPTNNVVSVMTLDDGSIVVQVLTENQTHRLYRYTWDDYAPISAARTLTVWSLEDNDFVRAAITQLRRMFPDSHITYEIALGGEGAASVSDAIRSLNTRLLSGRGPDVIVLDGIPMENYINRGMLLDLSNGINTGDIFPNLRAPYVMPNGAVYAIPMQFSVPILVGSEGALADLQTLNALVNHVTSGNAPPTGGGMGMLLGGVPENERPELHFDRLEELFDLLWLGSGTAIVQGNQLDTDALRQFLGAMEAISTMYNLGAPATGGGQFGGGGMRQVIGGGGGRVNIVPSSLMRYIMHTTNMAAFPANNLMILNMLDDRDDTEITTFPSMLTGAWQPSTVVSISADTDVADFALTFVNVMLSTQVQQINYGEGLPVTRSGMAAQMDAIEDFGFNMEALIQQLETPALLETDLRNIIWETVERLCTGILDLEGAVNEVERNLRIYLAERS